MKSTEDTYAHNDASGIIPCTFEGMNLEFSSFEQLHVSERHILWKVRRYNRWWILKGLPPEADNEANRAALRKEFEIMMRLPADGFPQAFSIEEVVDHGPCIVMEYIDGVTLGDWLETKPPIAERKRIALELMEIVARMHGCGIVSRDIKPSNIVISRLSGQPVLIDFDLADTSQHTAFKQPGGTAGYISPEQAVQFVPDRRNDIYSLAKVILEMRPPLIWRPTLRRCLKNIECRISDADRLRKRLSVLSRITRICCALLGVALIVVSVISFWPSEEKGRVETITKVVTLPADNRKADNRKADNRKADSLSQQFTQLRDSIQSEKRARSLRRQLVDETSRQACQWIRDYFSKHYKGVYDPYFDAWLKTGMDSIHTVLNQQFTASEVAEIEKEMIAAKRSGYAQAQKND